MNALKRQAPVLRAVLALVVVFALGLAFNADGAFLKIGTHRDALRQASIYGILACGMTLVIISGGIDLAVGSVVGLTAVLFSKMTIWMGLPPIVTVVTTLMLGAATGAISGFLVAYPRIQPFIADNPLTLTR